MTPAFQEGAMTNREFCLDRQKRERNVNAVDALIARTDAIHHRGQLTTYLRPMGSKVPSIYGPSADDRGM
jgi:uncharacterized damage-inducible protein DinB